MLRIAMRAAIDAPLRVIVDGRLDIGKVHRAVADGAGGQEKRIDPRGRRAIHVHDNFVLKIESYISHERYIRKQFTNYRTVHLARAIFVQIRPSDLQGAK